MTEDQILYQFGENGMLILSLMQWWLSISAELFAALHFYAEQLTLWVADFMLYTSLGLCSHIVVMLAKACIGVSLPGIRLH